MTKRLIKTRRDHAAMRAIIEENTKPSGLALSPAAGALTAGTVGTPHAGVTFTSSDAVGDPAFSVAAGALPAGMALNAQTGVLDGTPTAAGNASFSVRVSDAVGNTKVQAYTLSVAAP